MLRPKQILKEIGKAYPEAWKHVKSFRAGKGKDLPDWADWCYIPLAAGVAIATGGDNTRLNQAILQSKITPAVITAAASWRVTQGVYRFDADLYNTLIDQPLDGNIPCEVLKRMPEWCVYIEMINTNIVGFWAHLEDDVNDGRMELRFIIMLDNGENMSLPLHLGDWTIKKGLEQMRSEAQKYAQNGIKFPDYEEGFIKQVTGMIQLVLYLCAENVDMPKYPQHPINRVRISGQVDVPREPQFWHVGERIGSYIRKFYNEESIREGQTKEQADTRASMRPHIRKAHWHHYWKGPREGERKLILRWLPPIPVNIKNDDENEIPVVIKRVK